MNECVMESTACNCNCVFGGAQVNGAGDITSPVVIIGESPGAVELVKKRPWSSGMHQVVDEAIADAYKALGIEKPFGLVPLQLNALACMQRTQKDPAKLVAAVNACRPRLLEIIKRHPRKIIICMGNAAIWSLTGDSSLKITKVRGTRFPSALSEHGIVATVHPSFLLRGAGNYPQFKDDFKFVISLLHSTPLSKPSRDDKGLHVPYRLVRTQDELEQVHTFLQLLPAGTIVGSDIETSGFHFLQPNEIFTHYPSTNNILCYGMYTEGECFIIPQDMYSKELFPEHLKFVWHNGKFDVKFFWHHGVTNARVDEDTMLMSYGLNERRGIHDLDQVAADHLGTPNHKDMLEAHLPKKRTSYANISPEVLYQYLAYDVYKTYHLHGVLKPKVLADANTSKLYTGLFIPASQYLAEIEYNGLPLDREWTLKNLEEMTLEAANCETNLNSYSREVMGVDVNPRSPKQLQELLYNRLKLARPGTGTDVDTLDTLPNHPVVTELKKYRKVHKGLSTYVQSALDNVQSDGRVHTSFLIHGTVTGRLASKDPNLQNIPRLPKLRGQYAALPGFVFIEPDLNQAELRSLACMSGDDNLCRIYNTEGMSLHDEVRDFIFGTPNIWTPEQLERYIAQFNAWQDTPEKSLKLLRDEQKMIAKNVNFGIVYGITPYGLEAQIERPVGECEQYINAWFTRFPKAKTFIDNCKDAATYGRDIVTVYGRKKRGGIVTLEKLRDLQNEASNFPHQATASDFMLDTGIRMRKTLRDKFKTTVHNTVHDSVLLMTPKDIPLIKEVVEYTTTELANTPKRMGMTRVPFKADAKIGYRWGHCIESEKWLKLEAA